MLSTVFLSGFSNWDNPVTYLTLLVLFVVFLSARIVVFANKVLKQEGIEITHVVFKNNFGGILKWSSAHPRAVSLILIIIALLGIIWALTSGI